MRQFLVEKNKWPGGRPHSMSSLGQHSFLVIVQLFELVGGCSSGLLVSAVN